MIRTVLLTAATEDTEIFRSELNRERLTLLHYPLERYQPLEADEALVKTLENLEDFENIIYGSKRNAKYFISSVKEFDKLEITRQQLNLALDQHTANYLEGEGIPAIHPHAGGEAINLVEFMLRVRRIGQTLYPCGNKTAEDLPGLLQELDVPVEELAVFNLKGPREEELQKFQQDIAAHEPAVIIFHSRRSVNRMLAAFPHLDTAPAKIISGDRAVSQKLAQENIAVDSQAEGSWGSILEKVKELL